MACSLYFCRDRGPKIKKIQVPKQGNAKPAGEMCVFLCFVGGRVTEVIAGVYNVFEKTKITLKKI